MNSNIESENDVVESDLLQVDDAGVEDSETSDEYTEMELIGFELEYVGFRVSENVERLRLMTVLVNHLEFQHNPNKNQYHLQP